MVDMTLVNGKLDYVDSTNKENINKGTLKSSLTERFSTEVYNEISATILVCENCHLHSWNTKHDPQKYDHYYN